jgi:transcriptional regulator with XRE-family HTH domain
MKKISKNHSFTFMAVKRKIKKVTDLEQLGINIRRYRNQREITMSQLAYELDTSEKHVSRVELGQVNGGILMYIKIARVLDITKEQLFYKVKF